MMVDLVPRITDDAQTAQNKISELRSMLGDTRSILEGFYYGQ
jgi:hypothetical protein